MDKTTKALLSLVERFDGKRIQCQTRQYLARQAQALSQASQARAQKTLSELSDDGPQVLLGQTLWKEAAAVRVPLEYLVKAHSIITGGTGSGKTMSALAIIETILAAQSQNLSFGVLDAKGELFERTLCMLARCLEKLPPAEAQALRNRIVIVDLACADPLSSYNIASPWSGADPDFFATSRVDTLQELLPSGDGLSLRGASIVKHVFKLLSEHHLPFSYFDRALSSDAFRGKLLLGSKDDDLRYYFRYHFPNEGRATIAAVRGRVGSALLTSLSLKLALSAKGAPDFRRLQDEGKIVLINCAGPNIPRATARTLQALFLSDIRQAVFTRTNDAPFLWICDEAQNFFRTKYLRENMVDLLTMSRSFGSFFLYLTQNLSTAVQDREMLETLHTNIRWSLTMRGTSQDAAFLQPALPVTGRMQKPRVHPAAPVEFYKPAEERSLLMQSVTHLPDRVGWLWLKSRTGEALQIRTKEIELPTGAVFQELVSRMRGDPRIGNRQSRSEFLAAMEKQDAEWLTEEQPEAIDTALTNEAKHRR
jgi:hypothetical protein